MLTNIISGAVLLAFSVAYWLGADAIPSSPLSGNVGADGLPKLLAYALAVLSLALIVQTLLLRRTAPARVGDGIGEAGDDEGGHRLPLEALAIGLGFVVALPFAGYFLSVALLLITVSLFYGRKLTPGVIAYGVIGAGIFHLVFVSFLGVLMPTGIWPDLLAMF